MKNICLILVTLSAAMLASCGGGHKNVFPNQGDIGSVKFPGSVSFDAATGTYTMSAAGTNMWGAEDAFFMIWREVAGDFSLSADVAFEGAGVNPHRKIGLIVRDGLDADAVYADVAVHGDGLTSLQYRTEKGAETFQTELQLGGGPLPGRVSIVRRGNLISIEATGLESDNPKGGNVMALPETCLVGLFVCSHETDVVETARFSNVVFSRP